MSGATLDHLSMPFFSEEREVQYDETQRKNLSKIGALAGATIGLIEGNLFSGFVGAIAGVTGARALSNATQCFSSKFLTRVLQIGAVGGAILGSLCKKSISSIAIGGSVGLVCTQGLLQAVKKRDFITQQEQERILKVLIKAGAIAGGLVGFSLNKSIVGLSVGSLVGLSSFFGFSKLAPKTSTLFYTTLKCSVEELR